LAAKGRSKLQEIPFHSVSDISIHEDGSINLKLVNGSEFSFYVDLLDEHKKWIQYCDLLFNIPYYYVPEEPNYSLIPQNFIDKFKNPTEFHAGRFYNILVSVNITLPFLIRAHLDYVYHP